MSELPDFTTAPAWLDRHGQIHTDIDLDPDMEPWLMHQRLAPFIPLRTAGEWGKLIDREKLAEMLKPYFNGGDVAYGEHVECADAVLAALPELMGGAA